MIADVVGMERANAGIRQLKSMLNQKKEVFARGALHEVAAVFDKNFAAEGKATGGWAPLAEQTQRRREALGFGAKHPILVRYADLRQFTAQALKTVGPSASFAGGGAGGRDIRVVVSSGNGAVNVVASGGQAENQIEDTAANRPARPFWYINQTVLAAVRRGGSDSLHKEILRLN
jgi:hypothetical protein